MTEVGEGHCGLPMEHLTTARGGLQLAIAEGISRKPVSARASQTAPRAAETSRFQGRATPVSIIPSEGIVRQNRQKHRYCSCNCVTEGRHFTLRPLPTCMAEEITATSAKIAKRQRR